MSKFQEAISNMKKKREETAKKIGMFVQGQAAENAPRKTGELARSITNEVTSTDTSSTATIGSNKEYAAATEFGVPSRNIPAQPYLRPAIEHNIGEIQHMIQEGIS